MLGCSHKACFCGTKNSSKNVYFLGTCIGRHGVFNQMLQGGVGGEEEEQRGHRHLMLKSMPSRSGIDFATN
jgi:hypothetical protein